ncbi:nuclear transport factor 2 family protein [Bacillus sp. Marseille-Q3570]|uniref:YybH family protein n=1 Tax=Bacillus sp. Marseille-Q3570 TaxID=2963522 RepID=UPI0021B7431A|nr:nuclear transport factor 2 family protein [Bacillus sp. Marseille-Q3570]
MGYKQALEAYIAATNTHDFNQVEKVLAENAIYWFTDKSCTTRNEIKAYFENAWGTIRDEVYRATDVQWITVNQQSAVCLYTFRWEGFYKGESASGSGRATNVFMKEADGHWKLKHEHLSS